MSRSMAVRLSCLLAILLATPLLLSGATSARALVTADQDELTIGLSAEPETLDPHRATSAVDATVLGSVFDPLLWRDASGEFHPGLAERWDVSADDTEYTFHLSEGITFHNGTPFDAESVKYNFDRIANPASSSGLAASLLGPYSHTEVIDPLTARVVFDEPNPAFLDGASQPFLGMISPAAASGPGTDTGRLPIGTGYMVLTDWEAGDHISLSRNDDYAWGSPAFTTSGPVAFERMTFRFYPEESLRLAAFQAGEVDVLDQVQPRDLAVLYDGRPYQSLNATALGVPISLIVNTEVAPTDELAVRQALNHVLDREQIVSFAFRGASQPAYAPLAPDTPDAIGAGAADNPYDPDFAASLLNDAGWVMQDSGIREKDGQPLVLRWAVGPWDAYWAELAQAQLSQLGAVIQIVPSGDSDRDDVLQDGEINMISQAVSGSDPIVLERLFATGDSASKRATVGSFNASLAKLLRAGAVARNEDERAEIYVRAQSLIMDDALMIPIALSPENVVFAMNVAGLRRDFRNGIWFHDVILEAPPSEPHRSSLTLP